MFGPLALRSARWPSAPGVAAVGPPRGGDLDLRGHQPAALRRASPESGSVGISAGWQRALSGTDICRTRELPKQRGPASRPPDSNDFHEAATWPISLPKLAYRRLRRLRIRSEPAEAVQRCSQPKGKPRSGCPPTRAEFGYTF